jgi:hypothetical protein
MRKILAVAAPAMKPATRCSTRILAAAVIAFALGATSAHAEAVFVPTGGMLDVNPATVPAANGHFSGIRDQLVTDYFGGSEPTTRSVTLGHITGNYVPNAVLVSGRAMTYRAQTGGTYGTRLSGQIGFDLTETALVYFSLAQTSASSPQGIWNADPGVSVTLWDGDGNIVLGCAGRGTAYNLPGGCSIGSQPIPWDNQRKPFDGAIELAAGHYELGFSSVSDQGAGVPFNSDFSFGVSTVPLPG